MRRCMTVAALALAGCSDPAPAVDAGSDAGSDAPDVVDAPAEVDVGEVAVDAGRVIPPCAAPV
ncbi:MAG: hypothetical protein JWM10_1905, partial [Myxococcaceae bacterium]|nr:hypothetical protein [Myxococcaceae bacterium]